MLGDFGKLIVAKGFKNLPKVQKIARSGHTDGYVHLLDRGDSSTQQVMDIRQLKIDYFDLIGRGGAGAGSE